MTNLLSIVTAIMMTTPYNLPIEIVDLHEQLGWERGDHQVMGRYREGTIYIDRYIPRYEIGVTVHHEICHHEWSLMTTWQRERIRRRLQNQERVYSKDVEEEYCERIGLMRWAAANPPEHQ